MTDRAAQLRALADEIADRDGTADAWTAKSFTDRLFVVEVPPAGSLPSGVSERLHEHELREADEVYDVDADADGADFAGPLSDGRRCRFVGVPDRGNLQSDVID